MKCYVCNKPTAFMIKCDNCGDTRCTSAGCVGTICTKPGKYHSALAPCNCCSGKNGRYQKV